MVTSITVTQPSRGRHESRHGNNELTPVERKRPRLISQYIGLMTQKKLTEPQIHSRGGMMVTAVKIWGPGDFVAEATLIKSTLAAGTHYARPENKHFSVLSER